jgi:hypothetical protein
MASDIAPAAVPDPGGPSATDTPNSLPGKGGLSLLAPIEPARPTSASFNLDPAATTPDTIDPAHTSASSSTYQNDTQEGAGAKESKQQTGVMRSFALAAIERWKKGGDARNKRLDIQKAKAQAYQTKESRTVNRSEKFVGGSTNSGTSAGKSTDSKTKNSGGPSNGSSRNSSSKSNGPTGPKNSRSGGGSSGSGGAGGSKSNGRSGSGTASGAGGSGAGRGAGGSSGHGNNEATPKPKKDTKGHHEATGNGSGSKKTPGKTRTGPGTRTETATCGDSSGISLTKDKKPKNGDSTASTKKTPAPAPGKDNAAGTGNTGGGQSGAAPKQGSSDSAKTDLAKKDTPNAKGKTSTPKDGTTPPKTTGQDKAADRSKTTGNRNGTPPKTQPSREAGYRDGARTATVTAHINAYRDGFKDGHHDRSEAAQREKERLDQARADRKQQRAAEDQPVTASSTDHQPDGPQPIEVKEVTADHITLDGGRTFTRGEVRNLKQYERRLGEKATSMGKAAEGTRQLQAHAEQQAAKALKFLETAKNLKSEGGDRFVGVLTRLHEAATIQIREAQELHKRVVRAAENTQVVLVNVEIRYGGIYKAVCDSPLTKPAELNWYRK